MENDAGKFVFRNGERPFMAWAGKAALLILAAATWTLVLLTETAHALTPIEAGQKGSDWMAADAINWQNRNRCFGCHVQGETIWGLSIGKNRGYIIDTAKLGVVVNALKSWQCSANGSWYWSVGCGSGWQNESTVYAASALAFYDKMVATDAQANLLKAAAYLKAAQQIAGYWTVYSNGGVIMNGPYYWGTAMGIIAMKRASDLTGDASYKTSYEKAVAWLKTQYSTSVQDNAFKLIGLVEGGLPNTDPDVIDTKNRLLVAQRPDGGWGSYATYSSNAYNTGQAVYSLRLAGMLLQDSAIDAGIKWLVANQNGAGYWPTGSSGIGTLFASTMWPVIALGQFGSLGVELTADPLKQQVLARQTGPQTVEYVITVKNTGTQIQDDTYDISVTGAMEGWNAALSQSSITLVPGAAGAVILTVTAPAGLPDGLPSMLTITAVSRTKSDVSSSVMVTTFTPPDPPTEGHKTEVVILQGNGAVISQCGTATFQAKVIDKVSGGIVTGPGKGAVNFLVAGIAVGSASDSDGQGLFTVTWSPGRDWTKVDSHSLLAVYSGVDLPNTTEDLLSSFLVGSVTINPAECNQAPLADAGPDRVVECGEAVIIDGSGSSDPDGDALSYTWTWNGGSASGMRPVVTLPLGTHAITLTVDDGKGGTATDTATITVRDIVPPVTTVGSIAGVAGDSGWYKSAVTVTLDAADDCSGVKEIHYTIDGVETIIAGNTASFTISVEGSHSITYYAKDSAGNSETPHPLAIKIDKTSPSITASVSPAPNAAGWHNTDVTVTFTCTDATSGIASCSGPITVTTEGASQIITGTAVDKAGNTGTTSVTLNIDKTAPSLSVFVNPGMLWPPNHKMVTVTPSVSVTDASLGTTLKLVSVISSEPDNGLGDGDTANDIVINADGTISLRAERSGNGTGRVYTITYQATDIAGNISTASAAVTVPHNSK